jgi:hypothetical protein
LCHTCQRKQQHCTAGRLQGGRAGAKALAQRQAVVASASKHATLRWCTAAVCYCGKPHSRCTLPAACCLLPAACCLLAAACCMLRAAQRTHHVHHKEESLRVREDRRDGRRGKRNGEPSTPAAYQSTRDACWMPLSITGPTQTARYIATPTL